MHQFHTCLRRYNKTDKNGFPIFSSPNGKFPRSLLRNPAQSLLAISAPRHAKYLQHFWLLYKRSTIKEELLQWRMPRVQAFSHPNVRWPRNGRICKNRELQVQKVLASREESAVEGKNGQDERKNKPIYILFERFFWKYKSRCQYPRFLIQEKKLLSKSNFRIG